MVVRVTEPGRPAFSLRKGEEGLSVFVPDLVDPPLTEAEILENFRPGSQVIFRSESEVTVKGLNLVPISGADPLPARLRNAHAEIRSGLGMTRSEFKHALRELE
jgi:hypothetical protein